jgi:hypothetical protein
MRPAPAAHPVSPEVKDWHKIVGDETNPLEKAAYFSLDINVPWCAERVALSPSIGERPDGGGDCGVQGRVYHALPSGWRAGTVAIRLATQAGRFEHARLGGNLYRAMGLVAGRCLRR